MLALSMLLFLPQHVQSAQEVRALDTEIHQVSIDDAYYIETDIYVYITCTVMTDATTERYYLQIKLINPLGEESTVLLHIITDRDTLNIEAVFYYHATVSGDYIAEATIIANDNGWFALTDVLVFDPPGGSEGDPYVGITIG